MSARLTDDDFAAVRDCLATAAGLAFDESRRPGLAVVVAERLRASGASGVPEYLDLLRTPVGADERQRLLDAVTVQETHFFRNAPQMAALRGRVLPDLLRRSVRRERPLTIWSAGCSTGDEAYTLAMLLLELAPACGSPTGPEVRIVATDVSAKALRAAARGVYSGRSIDAVPTGLRERWFEPRPGGAIAVRDEVRRLVDLRLHNLVTDPSPFEANEVDLVVCRNVTIYFSRPTTRLLIGSFHDVLDRDGYLLLGHSETLWQVSDAFTLVPMGEAFFYRRTRDARTASRQPGRPARAPSAVTTGSPERSRPAGSSRRTTLSSSRPATVPSARRVPAQVTTAAGHLDAARRALAGGDYRQAAQCAEAATALDSLLAEGYVVLGQARSSIGLDSQAVEALRKAIYLEPTAGHAHFLLGGALARTGQHGSAAVSYRAAVHALPSTPPAVLDVYLGGRSVQDLIEVCERLARVATELVADESALASGRGVS